MPGRDGTGPMGVGSMSGKGLGLCIGVDYGMYGENPRFCLGLRLVGGCGCRTGSSMGPVVNPVLSGMTHKDMPTVQKELLRKRIYIIEKQLWDL